MARAGVRALLGLPLAACLATYLAARGGHPAAQETMDQVWESADGAWQLASLQGSELAAKAWESADGAWQFASLQVSELAAKAWESADRAWQLASSGGSEVAAKASALWGQGGDKATELVDRASELAVGLRGQVNETVMELCGQAWEMTPPSWQPKLLAVASAVRSRATREGAPLLAAAAAGALLLLASMALVCRWLPRGAAPESEGAEGQPAGPVVEQVASKADVEQEQKEETDGAAEATMTRMAMAPSPLRTRSASRRSRAASPAPLAPQGAPEPAALPPKPPRPSAVRRRLSRGASPGAPAAAEASPPSPEELAALAMVNHGSLEELLATRGIGPKSADAIIAYRKGRTVERLDELVTGANMRQMHVNQLLAGARG